MFMLIIEPNVSKNNLLKNIFIQNVHEECVLHGIHLPTNLIVEIKYTVILHSGTVNTYFCIYIRISTALQEYCELIRIHTYINACTNV